MIPSIFSQFTFWSGTVPAGFTHDCLGVITDVRFNQATITQSYVAPMSMPPVGEEYFEWIDVLEAVASSHTRFTMVEAGAGHGRWMAIAAKAAEQKKLALRLVGIEAEATHFEWVKEHFLNNGIDPAAHTFFKAPLAGDKRIVKFLTGRPRDCYGQSIVASAEQAGDFPFVEMETITLTEVLGPLELVDLIDMDIQGAEAEVLEQAIDMCSERVRMIHIGTHSSEIEDRLRRLFKKAGWTLRFDFPGRSKTATPYGIITFDDGVQSWANPRLI